LKKTVDSIKVQEFQDFEVWVVDGNSSKETQEYLKKLAAPFFYQSQNDTGIYDAMNKGVSLSTGAWFYFLGAGDCIENASILSTVSENLNFNLDVLYGNIRYDKTQFISKFNRLLWIKNTLHHQSVFYNKNLFAKINYETSYKVLADYHFNLNLYCKKIKAKKIDAIISNCNKEGISKKYNWSLYREELKLKKAHISSVFHPLLLLLVVLKFIFRKL